MRTSSDSIPPFPAGTLRPAQLAALSIAVSSGISFPVFSVRLRVLLSRPLAKDSTNASSRLFLALSLAISAASPGIGADGEAVLETCMRPRGPRSDISWFACTVNGFKSPLDAAAATKPNMLPSATNSAIFLPLGDDFGGKLRTSCAHSH